LLLIFISPITQIFSTFVPDREINYIIILKEVGKKKEKKTFSTLSLSLITTHIDTSHLYLYWKNKQKKKY